jgi:outer membrane protein, multidrug efflux system
MMRQAGLLSLLPILALAGCASFEKPAPRPQIAVPVGFVFAPPGRADTAIGSDRLLPVNDPAFQALVKRAATAPDLGVALARIDAARAVAKRAGAERLPKLDASGTTGVQRSNPNQFGNAPSGIDIDSTRFSIGGDIVASWDLDLFGQLRASERAAKYRLDAAGFDAQAVRIALVSEIGSALVDWQSIEAQREQTQSDIRAAEDRAGLIRNRVRAGLNSGLDAMRAEAVVEAQRAGLAALDGSASRIVSRLMALTATAGETVVKELKLSKGQWNGGPAPVTAPSALIAIRPDVQAAAARLAASDADLAATAARRFPSFNLSSALGLLAFSLGGIFDTDAITGQLGAGIAGQLLDFGRIKAEIENDKAQAKIAFEELRKATFVALGEAEEALGQLDAVEREAALLATQAKREADVATVSASRNRAGLESLITVLDADRIAYRAQQQAIAAKGRTQRARIALWQSLGGPDVEQFFL